MDMNLGVVIICGLAGWRLAYFLVNERGLFNLGGLARYLAGQRVVERTVDTPNGKVKVPTRVAYGEIARMLECVWCSSFWTSILMFILWQSPYAVIVWLFAIAAVSVLAHQVSEHV